MIDIKELMNDELLLYIYGTLGFQKYNVYVTLLQMKSKQYWNMIMHKFDTFDSHII